MVKLIGLEAYEYRPSPFKEPIREIRLHWDNGRHQAISIKTLDADGVKQALLDAAHLVGKEQRNEKI